MNPIFRSLEQIKKQTGPAYTSGISDNNLVPFVDRKDLNVAVNEAIQKFDQLSEDEREILLMPEKEVLSKLQAGFINFYSPDSISPYVPLASKGPWIISAYGAVIYDTGGYGMLGFGHNPDEVSGLLSKPCVMANIMTASFEQNRVVPKLKKEIGHTRKDGCPYDKFIFMNSGSEAMSVATRISDLHAGLLTDKGGRYEGKKHKIGALKGSFHGRTGRPARASNSSLKGYLKLASFRNYKDTLVVEPNDVRDLERLFKEIKDNDQYLEFFVIEPVMGEGNPGLSITPEFYKRVRELSYEYQTIFMVDSVQAGLRANGVLSIVDYPGFQDLDPPDIESFSKAINGGQFPVSMLAVKKELADIYQAGIYGNTMTANPRALDLTVAVIDLLDDSVRKNIRAKGTEFLQKLEKLKEVFPDKIKKVQGTGLLVSAELSTELSCVGFGSIEDDMRRAGVNVIHGGTNSLRFTPWFKINSDEVDLIVKVLNECLEMK